MRLCYMVATCLTIGMLAGCGDQHVVNHQNSDLDVELVKTLNNIGVENAIIAQHTIYPYHFIADADGLNELGRRDLAVLANHFKEYPGTLNVQRGSEAGALYEARVAQVVAGLKAAGVAVDRMTVTEGMPGGSGISSERVITILKSEPDSAVTTGYGTTGAVRR